jgi:hypothetical protein
LVGCGSFCLRQSIVRLEGVVDDDDVADDVEKQDHNAKQDLDAVIAGIDAVRKITAPEAPGLDRPGGMARRKNPRS